MTTRKNQPKKPTKKEQDAFRKQVIAEEQNKLEKTAQKIALKTMTEIQLATQVELTNPQKEAIKLLSSGYNFEETAEKLKLAIQQITSWMALPSFVRQLNEATIKSGLSDKNERIRKTKRIAQKLTDQMIEKLETEDITKMNVFNLSKLAMEWSQRLDKLMEDSGEKGEKNRDLTVLILQHVQGQGKQYDKLEDFLSDPEFSFPTIDVIAKEVENEDE